MSDLTQAESAPQLETALSRTSSERPRAYIASPLGFTEAGRYYYHGIYLPRLREIVEPVCPWELTSEQEVLDAQANGTIEQFVLEIGRRNVKAMRSSEIMIAHLDGQACDEGTVGEVGYCAGIGLRCYGVRSDFRSNGEHGAIVNLQIQTFIVDSGGFIATSLDELVERLTADLSA